MREYKIGDVIIGFTGTRKGMTPAQVEHVCKLIENWKPTEVHHGDCVGADAQFHRLVRSLAPNAKIIKHPACGVAEKWKAKCEGGEELAPKPPLERNRDIVDASDIMVACPGGPEELRSGTWATIRYTILQHKELHSIAP